MKGLCIDTSGQRLTLVLWDGDRMITAYSEPAQQRHSDLMIAMLDSQLRKAHLEVKDIEVVAVCSGPGSFTGLRVGISLAKGLAMGLGVKMLALNTLEAMAFSAEVDSGPASPMLDAQKKQVYAALYHRSDGKATLVKGPVVVDPQEWLSNLPQGTVVFGSGATAYRCLIDGLDKGLVFSPIPEEPTPQGLVALANRLLSHGEIVSPEMIDAFYVRRADAIRKMPGE